MIIVILKIILNFFIQPPPAYDDPSPLVPFRPRERESKKKVYYYNFSKIVVFSNLNCFKNSQKNEMMMYMNNLKDLKQN